MTATPRKSSSKKTAGSKGSGKKTGAGKTAGAARTAKSAKPPARKAPVRTKPPAATVPKAPPVRPSPKPPVAKKPELIASPAPAKPVKLPKALVDPEWLKAIREALVQQRQRLHSVVQSTAAQMAERTGDLPDVSDRASEGYGDELAAGLLAIEAAQLDEIEAAIRRIDLGSYGICLDCHKAIPRKRLEILPFAQRCLNCKGAKERQIGGGYGDEEAEGKSEFESDDGGDSEERD